MNTHLSSKILILLFCLLNSWNLYAKEHSNNHSTDMSLHHMHVMINHAVEMAAEGSSLVMLGKMHMAEDVDNLTIEHGKQMIANAKALISKVIDGKAMQDMHKAGEGKTTLMQHTHQLATAAQAYIELLETMPDGHIHH